MTILVVGAGATGGYFGARLAQAGRDVTFLVRPHRAGQLRERGLRIVGPGAGAGAGLVLRPNLVLAGELTEPADVVILSVKATALEAAITDFAPAVGPQTAVVPFLNGLLHLPVLNKRFGEPAVFGGVVEVATQLNDEGDVVQLAPLATLSGGRVGAQLVDVTGRGRGAARRGRAGPGRPGPPRRRPRGQDPAVRPGHDAAAGLQQQPASAALTALPHRRPAWS
jgi:2-dehydropantoate 2-reductase